MSKIKWLLRHLFNLPWSSGGRIMRIERLMETTGEERDVCAAVVYTRDAARGFGLSDKEWEDFERIGRRLVNGEIVMPADQESQSLVGEQKDGGK